MSKYLILVLLCSTILYAGPFGGDWETVTTMNEITDISAAGDHLWVASTGGLFRFDTGSNLIRQYTNIDGMRTVSMRAVAADIHNHVICGGDNGILEIFDRQSGDWEQLYAIEGNQITDIISQQDTLWVAAGNGLAVFIGNESGYTFKDYFKNFDVFVSKVYVTAHFANRIWIGTDQGLLSAPSDLNRYTINDPANWKLFDKTNGLPHNVVFDLYITGNQLWVGTASGLATVNAAGVVEIRENWIRNSNQNYLAVNALSGTEELLYVASGKNYYTYSPANGTSWIRGFDETITTVVRDSDGSLWAGLNGDGLYSYSANQILKLEGPGSNLFRQVIRDRNGTIWASSGKPRLSSSQGYYTYDGDQWINTRFDGGEWWRALENTVNIYEDRFGNIWLCSWGGGLMVVKAAGDTAFFHNYKTSGSIITSDAENTVKRSLSDAVVYSDYFSGVVTAPTYEILSTVKEDNNGRMWFANYWASNDNLLAVAPYAGDEFISLDKDRWNYFGRNDGIIADEGGIIALEFDVFSNRVFIGTMNNGVYILEHNNTLSTKSDDQLFHLQINDNLYSNTVYALKMDEDGILWIGTAAGLNSYDGINVYRHVGDETGLSGPLDNRINHITVDRFNNKWFSTSGGLSILRAGRSPWDSRAWIGFNTENSGLVDNEVQGVFVDNQRGEALIGTDRGLSLYRGSFAEIRDDYQTIIGGPNPFILDGENDRYMLTHLKNNSTVKILSLNGALVRELDSSAQLSDGSSAVDGSRAVWDGRDQQGQQVASGVYLYMAFTEDGKTAAGKIAVIRK